MLSGIRMKQRMASRSDKGLFKKSKYEEWPDFPEIQKISKLKPILFDGTPIDFQELITMFVNYLHSLNYIDYPSREEMDSATRIQTELAIIYMTDMNFQFAENDFELSRDVEEDTSNLCGEKKANFIKKLERRLRFYLSHLPSRERGNEPWRSVYDHKEQLRILFRNARLEVEEYQHWFKEVTAE